MKFSDFLSESSSKNTLNEAVKFKIGSSINANGEKYVIIGRLNSGYLAMDINCRPHRAIDLGRIETTDLGSCSYVDASGKLDGKYPVEVVED